MIQKISHIQMGTNILQFKKSWLMPVIIALFFASCETSKPLAENKASGKNEVDYSSPHPGTYSVMWQQNSGEYKALCQQAFYIARKRLLETYENPEFENPAVVVDVDETILDNSPYFAKLALENKAFTSESWKEWTDMHAAAFVPGALQFLRLASSLGVPVFFVSNRDMDEVESTMQNLNELGYAIKDASKFRFKNESRSKEQRRKMIASKYDIILLIGDNLMDFSDEFNRNSQNAENDPLNENLMNLIGDKFIILPNSMYGEWLYNDNRNGPAGDELTKEGIKFRKSKLQSY